MPNRIRNRICRSLAALVAACTALAALAGDPYDYKDLETRRIRPEAVRPLKSGGALFDFGKANFGWVELNPPAGVLGAYELRIGELCTPEGRVNLKPGASVRATTVVGEIAADGVHRVPLVPDPRNTKGGKEGAAVLLPEKIGVVMPYRYVEVVRAPFPVTAETVRMAAVSYPMDMAASAFACDNADLVRVYDFCKHSIRATSFAGLYVDGDRERIPYEADAYLNQLGEYAVHADYSLARKSHEYLMEHPTWPTEWKQHSIMMAWADWMWSGDTRSLVKFYDRLKDDKLLLKFRRDDGLLMTGGERFRGHCLTNRLGAADIVDWPLGERDGFVFRDVNAVVNAFHYRNLREMSAIANALGREADARDFAAGARRVFDAFEAAFFDPSRGVYRDGVGTDHASLHANAAALAFGLVPSERRKAVADYLASRGMACSVYFAQYLLEAFFEAGEPDRAIALMTAKGDRSWLAMLDLGATITLEAWGPKYKKNYDMNHAWGTPPLNVISRYVLGVTPLEPGFARISVRPQVGSLRHVWGVVPTAKGPVRVRVDDDVLRLDVPGPARVEFGGKVVEVSVGHHEIGGW